MKKCLVYASLSLSISLTSCSIKLASTVDRTNEQIKAIYKVRKDVSYGSEKEQTMDIYISGDAKKLGDKNFTIVFIHGGGYYVSDKSEEEKYIEPYLKKGLNVINLNYRLKKGIPIATEDLTNALNFLKSNSAYYQLHLEHVILSGFSAGAHIASNVGVSTNNPEYPKKLLPGIKISGIINFSGPVDGLDVVEKVFIDNEMPIMKEIGNALFPYTEGYAPKDSITKYEPITYFDKNDPPFFLWHGGKDDQIPPSTFVKFVDLLNEDKSKNEVILSVDGVHDPTAIELKAAYNQIFVFLDKL
ncbi:alpha/beta hydrolase [Flavihumibacter fluvii]|uniref:alpha/beta hydrolase n=1 Tax=Flavihumibacter fluvii TaxID=2838157 RepID=UPI001BDE77FC|nr:alpha/beta hydrolase [Flavihumibacter fluvii]ULQ51320.1 alpha/beta hydrolase fold domain-containing protein [Flavihumibacter fluvii]